MNDRDMRRLRMLENMAQRMKHERDAIRQNKARDGGFITRERQARLDVLEVFLKGVVR